jgi:hypothetical protein
MCPFSIIKAKYRENVHKLAQFDDAAKIKKQHFLEIYNEARIQGMAVFYIKSG